MNLSIRTTLALACAALVFAQVAGAQDKAPDVLTQVQPNSALVVVLPSLDKANTTIEQFIKDLQLPVPMPPGGPVKALLMQMGLTDGVDLNGSMALVMPQFQLGGSEPPVYAAIPIADEAKLMATFTEVADAEDAPGVRQGKAASGELLYLRTSGKHLIVSPVKSIVKDFTPAADGAALMQAAGDLGRAQMHGGLAFVMLNMKVVGPQLAPMARMGMANGIKEMVDQIKREAENGNVDMAKFGGIETVEAGAQMVTTLVNNLLTQTDSIVASLNMDKTGLRLDGSVQFTPGSDMAKLFPGDRAPTLKLDRLPAGNYMMTGVIDSKSLPIAAIAAAFKEQILPKLADADPKVLAVAEAYVDAIEASGEFGLTQFGWYESQAKDLADFYRMAVVAEVDDGPATMARYRAAQKKMVDGIGQIMNEFMKAQGAGDDLYEMSYTENAETIDGVSVDRYRVKVNLPDEAAAMMPMGAMLTGPQDTLIGQRGNTIITTQGKGTELFKQVLATAGGTGKLGADASIVEARKSLPGHRIAEGYVNAGGLIEKVVDFAKAMMAEMGPGAPQMNLPAVPDMPPLALAMTNKSGGLGYSVAVPKKTIIAIKDFGLNAQAMIMAQMQPGGPGPGPFPGPEPGFEPEPVQPGPAPDDVYQPNPSDDSTAGGDAPQGSVKVTALSDNSFQAAVGQAKPTLVLFSASWSGDSKRQLAHHRALSRSLGEKVNFAVVDYDDAPDLCEDQGIVGVPTTILYKSGKKLETARGVQDAAALKKLLGSHAE